MKKRIRIEDLQPGMHLAGIDHSWLKTPFWLHRRIVKSDRDVRELRQSGVRWVFIETAPESDEQAEISEQPLAPHPHLEPVMSEAVSGMFTDKSPQTELPMRGTVGLSSSFHHQLEHAHEMRAEAVQAVERIFDGVKTGVPLEVGMLREVTSSLLKNVMGYESPMLTELQLQRMKRFDHSLFSHSVDVCVLSCIVGLEAQLNWDQLQDLAVGALLHDIGQLRLPRNLLLKSGVFSMQERKLFEAHPVLGAKIVWDMHGASHVIQRIVAEHHERINGTGYPWERRGKQISPLAQLVGLVDRYDALVSTRGRRPGMPPALAVRRIYQLGIHGEFDMMWVDRLIRCISIYPVGSLVELNTGERGWVISVNQSDRLRPTIKVVWDRRRQKLEVPFTIELSSMLKRDPAKAIQRVLNPQVEGVSEDLFNVFDYAQTACS